MIPPVKCYLSNKIVCHALTVNKISKGVEMGCINNDCRSRYRRWSTEISC